MIDEDYQAWDKYPDHRWVFNKLDIALRLGYQAGPACVPLPKVKEVYFKAIIRPIYNLYGMGIGARIFTFNPGIDNEFIVNHGCIPPGYFWCEYFKGTHYSIDYKSTTAPAGSLFRWEPFHAMIGENTEKDLTRFKSWVSVEPPKMMLPHFINKIMNVDYLNIECIDDKIIEIHLRTGNDILHNTPIGTEVIPIWSDEENTSKELEKQGYQFKSNLYPDSFNYGADGHLKYVREGYMIK
jgi:hypothetical protein